METDCPSLKTRRWICHYDSKILIYKAIASRSASVSLHLLRYKFIVDGEWRFSPEDPIIPDTNGNINNFIDTTNFQKMIETKTKT